MTLFSFASAPGANAHTADAQLPAYWRIDGRNDTLSGRKLPRIGKKTSAATIVAVSHGDDMFDTAYPCQAGKPRNKKIDA